MNSWTLTLVEHLNRLPHDTTDLALIEQDLRDMVGRCCGSPSAIALWCVLALYVKREYDYQVEMERRGQ